MNESIKKFLRGEIHGRGKAQLFGAAKTIYRLNNISVFYTLAVSSILYLIDWVWVVDLVGYPRDEDGKDFLPSLEEKGINLDEYKNTTGFSIFWGWPARFFMIFSIIYGAIQGYKYKDELSYGHHRLKYTLLNIYAFLFVVTLLVILFSNGVFMSLDLADALGYNPYLYFWGYLYGSWVFSWLLHHSTFYFCSGIFKSKSN